MTFVRYHQLRALFRYLKWGVTGVLLIIAIYLLMALILSVIPTNPGPVNCVKKKEIFVATNGVHLALILPKELIRYEFKRALELPAHTDFVSFGWGDREFYLNTPEWADLRLRTAAKALFVKSETAMHVTNYHKPKASWKAVAVCPSQIESLNDFVIGSFKFGKDSLPMQIEGSGYGQNDIFYEGAGSYTCFRTCNSWVNEGLKKGKIKTSLWSPFDRGVLYHLDR